MSDLRHDNQAEVGWPERGIWSLMTRAEPAMRDELLKAWDARDTALAALARVEDCCENCSAIGCWHTRTLLPSATDSEEQR